jgi:ATP phosphoribosyltransferase regulatory subunit
MDSLLRALPAPAPGCRLFAPVGADDGIVAGLRAEGWRVAAALETCDDAAAEARRQGCSHVLADGAIVALDE